MIKNVRLFPFKQSDTSVYGFHASAVFLEHSIFLSYAISGNICSIKMPSNDAIPEKPKKLFERKDELWKSTCFEFFLLKKDQSYIEVNLSPSSAYNVYSFHSYREGMQENHDLFLSDLQISQTEHDFKLDCILKTKGLSASDFESLNMSSILKFKNQEKEFWALKHTKSEPDFHNREDFIKFS